jgi:hypothetical protein
VKRSPKSSGDPSRSADSDTSPPAPADTSQPGAGDASPLEGRRICRWCRRPLEATARKDAEFCGRKCRQTAFRLRKRAVVEVLSDRPLRLAYADPPYPGLAKKYYQHQPTYRGEVDHRALLASLEYSFDGWALSTSARALRELLPLCPPTVRVCAWVKPKGTSPKTYGLHNSWEPVLIKPARAQRPGVRDWLLAHAARGGGELPGRKPIAFCAWLFEAMGARPGDELADLFPGTGIVGRAFIELGGKLSPLQAGDASLTPASDVSLAAAGDTAPDRTSPLSSQHIQRTTHHERTEQMSKETDGGEASPRVRIPLGSLSQPAQEVEGSTDRTELRSDATAENSPATRYPGLGDQLEIRRSIHRSWHLHTVGPNEVYEMGGGVLDGEGWYGPGHGTGDGTGWRWPEARTWAPDEGIAGNHALAVPVAAVVLCVCPFPRDLCPICELDCAACRAERPAPHPEPRHCTAPITDDGAAGAVVDQCGAILGRDLACELCEGAALLSALRLHRPLSRRPGAGLLRRGGQAGLEDPAAG